VLAAALTYPAAPLVLVTQAATSAPAHGEMGAGALPAREWG
jgi:hypothetical protein